MAELTTIEGFKYNFEPNAVFAVADRDVVTGNQVTCVYGVTATDLKIDETVQDFMARLGIANNFVVLTRPNDWPIWIGAGAVSSVSDAYPPEFSPPIKSIVTTRARFGVIEDRKAALAIINTLRKDDPL